MAQLTYQGHGSLRIVSSAGAVLYLDPFAGEGYDLPADLVLVTHDHHDHNRVDLVAQNPDCRVITFREALKDGVYRRFSVCGFEIEAVPAGNKNHDPACCVGFLISVDGVALYAAGDTSTTDAMAGFAARKLDWALLPIDGVYNMGPEEASRAAELISVVHSVPIHMMPGALFDEEMAARFNGPGKTVLRPGQTVEL